MKLISWNCQGSFRNKADLILTQQPDILIVQECEHPDKLLFHPTTEKPRAILWFGDNKNKGIGIFSYSEYSFQLSEKYNDKFKYIIPINVSTNESEFTLFAIWANNKIDLKSRYIEQVWKAVNYYEEMLSVRNIILIGDFNSNMIWDSLHRIGNHSKVVSFLFDKNIHSVYHKYFNQKQGIEIEPTFYFHRKEIMPYHIDYCFTSIDLYDKLNHIEIGKYKDWIIKSDHCPIILTFNF